MSSTRKTRQLRWLVAVPILVGAVVFAALSISDFKATLFSTVTQQANCNRTHGPTDIPTTTSQGSTVDSVTAKLAQSQRTEVDFGRSLTDRTIVLYLGLSAVPKGPALFQLRMNPFVRSDDASLRSQDIFASAQRDGKTLF